MSCISNEREKLELFRGVKKNIIDGGLLGVLSWGVYYGFKGISRLWALLLPEIPFWQDHES